jgi:hypothetical protein
MGRGIRLPDKPTEDNAGVRGNSLSAEFGGVDAVNSATGSAGNVPTVNGVPNPPPKASAAPKGDSKFLFTGLCEALNYWQQGLVKDGTYEIADQYEIQFVPASMANARNKKPGNVDQSHTPLQQANTAKTTLDPATNTVSVAGRALPVSRGTQIIQYIDQVLRGSTYVSEQQLYQNNELTQKTEKNPSGNDKPTAWYKISAQVTSLGVDTKRNDQAYKIVYIVSPYGINETRSQYFPQTRFRGVHKNYDYWFTGKNTSVLNYEQQLNNLYFAVISESINDRRQQVTNRDDLYNLSYGAGKKSWQTRSNQSDQYASGNTNEPGANLADFLYTPDDFTSISLKIVGDPAWIPQGETSGGITENNFSFAAFNSDDGINFDAQEVAFSVVFNQPEDYNLDTGLMEVASNFKKENGEFGRNYPQQQQVYKTATIRHTFSRGAFTQNLEGLLYLDVSKKRTTDKETADTRPITPQSTTSRQADPDIVSGVNSQANFPGSISNGSEPPGNSTVPPDQNLDINAQPLQQTNPTSSGDITSLAAGDEDAQQVAFRPPPVPATADQLAAVSNGVRPTAQEIEARNAYIAAGSPSSGPLREAYVDGGTAFNNRVTASGPTTSAQPPQYGNREA